MKPIATSRSNPRISTYRHFPPKWYFVTAIGNSSISDAHKHAPAPFSCSQINGNPPIPSNRLAIVRSSSHRSASRVSTYVHGGSAILLPSALYRAASVLPLCVFPRESVHAPMSVQKSGYPYSRSHSSGVNLRAQHLRFSTFASHQTACWSCAQVSVPALSDRRSWFACPFPMQTACRSMVLRV